MPTPVALLPSAGLRRVLIAWGVGSLWASTGACSPDDAEREPIPEPAGVPFVIESNPALEPGSPGAWDAGGVFAPRVWTANGTARMLYVGMRTTGPFRNDLALGLAEWSGAQFSRSGSEPLLLPSDLHPGATGIEAPALVVATDDSVRLIATAVDSARAVVGVYDVALTLTGRVLRSIRLERPTPPPGDWNEHFALAEALDASGSIVASGARRQGGWHLGAQRLVGDSLVWENDPQTPSPFAGSDPVFRHSESGWDRHGVFNPATYVSGERHWLLYSGAPGAVDGDQPANTIGWACKGSNGGWVRPEGDNRLMSSATGTLVEYPFVASVDDGPPRLWVSVLEWPDGRHEIYRANGELPWSLGCSR